MKKLILTSAAVFLIGLSSFAQDGSKCSKKCEKKCEIAECKTDAKCSKKCDEVSSACVVTAKCNPATSKECAKKCKIEEAEKESNGVTK